MEAGAGRKPGPEVPPAIAALYFLSGITGLGYEVLWARFLSYRFGTSILGVAVTAAAVLLGLGAGAWLARHALRAQAMSRALLVFGALELAVALDALALPDLGRVLQAWLDHAGSLWSPHVWQFVEALVGLAVLALPASLLGAGFPALLQALPPAGSDGAGRASRLYGWNCLGAAIGAIVSLALLAGQGWSSALSWIAAGGVAVAICAGVLGARRWRAPAPALGSAASPQAARPPAGVLLSYAAVGACALLLEVGWTRLYGMALLRTEYVLALILAIYLLGTALGSLLASRLRAAPAWSRLLPAATCAAALLGLAASPAATRLLRAVEFPSLAAALAAQAALLALLVLPATAGLGAWLPLLARRTAGSADARGTTAWLYGANCLGGAAGALLAVAVGIPWLGTAGTLTVAALALLPLGATLMPAAQGAGPLRRHAPWLVALAPALALAWPLHVLAPAQRWLGDPGIELARYEDALTMHHVVEAADGQRTLLADLQRMDASTDPAAVRVQADQGRLALLLHGAPRRALFLGLGTGIAERSVQAWPGLRAEAVEISPGAVAAAVEWFAPANQGVLAHLQVHLDDARHFLLATPVRYDVIVGDLFHPDLAGMSTLLTIEHFARVREHLQPDGLFVQWLALNQFDADALDAVLRSYAAVFPGAVLFFDGMHLALVGAPAPQAWAARLRQRLGSGAAGLADEATGGEGAWTWLGRYCGPIAAGPGPLQSEERPLIEFRLPALHYTEHPPLADLLQRLLQARPDADAAAQALGVAAAERSDFDGAYAATGLALRAWIAALHGETFVATQWLQLANEANPRDRWVAGAVADERFERLAQEGRLQDAGALEGLLRIDPDHVEALRALWRLERAGGGPAPALARLRTLDPLDAEVRAAPR